MLTKLTIRGFKSYRKSSLQLAPLSLLVGANASGKSNALEAIRLLSRMARGYRFDDVWRELQEAGSGIRGSLDGLSSDEQRLFGFDAEISIGGSVANLSVILAVVDGHMKLVAESLALDDGWLYESRKVGENLGSLAPALTVAYNNFQRGPNKPEILCSDLQLAFTQLGTPARFGELHTKSQQMIPETCNAVRSALESIVFLDPNPRRMRSYSFARESTISEDGSNVSAILFNLVRSSASGREDLLGFIRSLPEQDIKSLGFIETARGEVMVELEEVFGSGSRKCDASLLSDGTLRVMAIAGALLSIPTGSLLVVEEIDNGIHPSRAEMILGSIQRIAKARRLSVLLTSHNPALLDALPLDAIPDVVCCFRHPEEGDSRLVRLEDLPNYPGLIAQGPVGSLMTRGILDRFLKDTRTPEERMDAALKWIAALKAEGA